MSGGRGVLEMSPSCATLDVSISCLFESMPAKMPTKEKVLVGFAKTQMTS